MASSDIERAVEGISNWKLLGINLCIPWATLDEIDYEHLLTIRQKKSKMIQIWMNGPPMATWSSLVEALYCPSIALHLTAEKISKQHSKCHCYYLYYDKS